MYKFLAWFLLSLLLGFFLLLVISFVFVFAGLFTFNLKFTLFGAIGFVVSICILAFFFKIARPCNEKQREETQMEKYGVEFDELVKEFMQQGMSEKEAKKQAKKILKIGEEEVQA